MCVKCDVNTAANAGDWKEVARLAREQDEGLRALALQVEEANNAGDKKAATSKVSSKKD